MFQDWLVMYKNLRDDTVVKSECICPECGAITIDLQFIGDVERRIGYLDMWCTTCNRGIHMSRVLIPEGAPLISFDDPAEVVSARIPDFEQVAPS
jgi:hypothetical protein